MAEPVHVFAHVTAQPGREADLRAALLALVDLAPREPGFIRYDLHEDADRPGCFSFYEIWQDRHALDLHGSSAEMRAHQALTAGWVAEVSVQICRKINR